MHVFKSNSDYKKRDDIIFGRPIHWKTVDEKSGGLVRFSDLILKKLDILINERYVNTSSTHNNSPKLSDILRFCDKYSCDINFVFNGMVFSPNRLYDYNSNCILVDTTKAYISDAEFTKRFLIDWCNLFREADELHLDLDCAFAWYG